MRHYATFRNEEYLIIGHNPVRNDCMVVRMAAIPHDDAVELRAIANSAVAQSQWYLVNETQSGVLNQAKHRTGHDWFTHLCKLMTGRGGQRSVLTLPLTQIQDGMDAEQRAHFKGYGSSVPRATDQATGAVANEAFAPPPAARHQTMAEAPAPVSPAAQNGLDYKLDLLTQTIVENQQATNKLLAALVTKLTGPAGEGDSSSEGAASGSRRKKS